MFLLMPFGITSICGYAMRSDVVGTAALNPAITMHNLYFYMSFEKISEQDTTSFGFTYRKTNHLLPSEIT